VHSEQSVWRGSILAGHFFGCRVSGACDRVQGSRTLKNMTAAIHMCFQFDAVSRILALVIHRVTRNF
jgi:hypothetical protein